MVWGEQHKTNGRASESTENLRLLCKGKQTGLLTSFVCLLSSYGQTHLPILKFRNKVFYNEADVCIFILVV